MASVDQDRIHSSGHTLSGEDTRRLVGQYVDHYNTVCLHSAIGYVTPKDMLEGKQKQIHTQRDLKLEATRQTRQLRRQQASNITQQNPSDSTGLELQ